MSIKCLLVDDHTLFRDGLRRVLESEADIQVVGEAGDAASALEVIGQMKPDVVREVYQGRKYLSPQVLEKLVTATRSPSSYGMPRSSMLTPREREVVKMI